jgi:ABC-type cobalamin/Fe3+-siderophores transport system ATPase subunit
MNIDIGYFNPATMREGAVVLVIGRRGSGKSTLAADIMSYQRHSKRGVCVSGTEKANPFWHKHIPECFIYYDYSDNVTKEIFKMQKKVKKKTGFNEPAFAIYDDCMFDKDFMKSKLTRQIFMNGVSLFSLFFVLPGVW